MILFLSVKNFMFGVDGNLPRESLVKCKRYLDEECDLSTEDVLCDCYSRCHDLTGNNKSRCLVQYLRTKPVHTKFFLSPIFFYFSYIIFAYIFFQNDTL